MTRKFRVPSKTILLGEYLALEQGEALVAAHAPDFQFVIHPAHQQPVHPDSPVGVYLKQLGRSLTPGLSLQEPRPKGFGLSSAEFLVIAAEHQLSTLGQRELYDIALDMKVLLQAYKSCHATPVSGVDLVTQWLGGIQQTHLQAGRVYAHAWPFADMHAVVVARAGSKPATRELLPQKNTIQNLGALRRIFAQALAAFQAGHAKEFARESQDYFVEMLRLGLGRVEVMEDIQALTMRFPILGAKGCGAGGVDTLLLYCDAKDSDALMVEAAQWGKVVGRLPHDLAPGLSVQG